MTALDLHAALRRLAAACDRASDHLATVGRPAPFCAGTVLAVLLTACTGIQTEVHHD